MEPEEIKAEAVKLKQKLEKRRGWNALTEDSKPESGRKVHRNCGGTVVYREPYAPTHYAYAGYCLKCEAFPIPDEDIIFKSVVKPEFHDQNGDEMNGRMEDLRH